MVDNSGLLQKTLCLQRCSRPLSVGQRIGIQPTPAAAADQLLATSPWSSSDTGRPHPLDTPNPDGSVHRNCAVHTHSSLARHHTISRLCLADGHLPVASLVSLCTVSGSVALGPVAQPHDPVSFRLPGQPAPGNVA